MKITPVLRKIAHQHAEKCVKADLEGLKRDLGAIDDAYDETGVPESTLAQDRNSLLDLYKKAHDPRLIQESFDIVRDQFLAYAQTLPDPILPCKPVLVPCSPVKPVICDPWYQLIPYWGWDPIDYEATRKKAKEAKEKNFMEWKEKMDAYQKKVVAAYAEALDSAEQRNDDI